jgi:hypothetical protein
MVGAIISRRRAAKLIIGVALLVAVGVLSRGCFPPSQRSLVRNFHRHRDSFEKARAMLDEDRAIVWEVTSRGCSAPGELTRRPPEELGLPQERYAEYLRLLKQAGAILVIRRTDETAFLVAGFGYASYGWRVAIVHRDTEPNDVIPSLHEFRRGASPVMPNHAYCPVEDNWYIWIAW